VGGRSGRLDAPSGDGIPDGIPVGRALVLPPRLLSEDLYQAVRSIDRVHGDGFLPAIPVILVAGMDRPGRFVERMGMPSALLIDPDRHDRGFVLLHEVGHLLDLAGLGTPGRFASGSGDAAMQPWRTAVERSQAVIRLAPLIDDLVNDLPDTHARRRRQRSMLELEEIWARSYAQFVACHSADPDLPAALDRARMTAPGTVYYPLQWGDDDFEPIGQAIDQLFGRIGWRSRKPRPSAKRRSGR
jgi:hypothetical protein